MKQKSSELFKQDIVFMTFSHISVPSYNKVPNHEDFEML